MSNLTNFFDGLGKAETESHQNQTTQKAEAPVEGSLLDLCYSATRGSSLLKPILDSNNVPLRVVNNVIDVYEKFPLLKADGTYAGTNQDGSPWTRGHHTFVMAPNNYVCQLTPEQVKLQSDLMAALNTYDRLVNEDEVLDPSTLPTRMYTTKRWKITMFWAKVLSLTVEGQGCVISDGVVRLCRHHGSSFREDLLSAMNDKTQLKGGNDAWQELFFNRLTGPQTAVMSCNIKQAQGFKNTISFEEQGPNYEVTEADIAVAGDLNAAGDNIDKPEVTGLNATVYPEQEMRDLLNRVQSYIAKFQNGVAGNVAAASAPQQAPAQAAPVQTQAAPQQMPPQSNLTGFFNGMQAANAQPVQTQQAPVQQVAPQAVQTPVQPVAPVQPAQPVVNVQTTPVQPVVTQAPVQPAAQPQIVSQAPQVPTL